MYSLKDEIKSLVKYKVLKLIKPPSKAQILNSKYIFKIKWNALGALIYFKVRFIIKGYHQIQGIDF